MPRDYLTPLLKKGPASWALIRANELKALNNINFKSPVLDVGCGDGVVAKVIVKRLGRKFDWGIDLSASEIEKAKKSGSYKQCSIENVYELPFKKSTFSTVFSNSVVEHIPDLEKAMSEMSRVLKKNGELVLTVPSPYLADYLLITRVFSFLGLKTFARAYGTFFNKLFKHYNLYNHNQWEKIGSKHYLKLDNFAYYHSQKLIAIHELLIPFAIPLYLSKAVFGHWIIFPRLRNILVISWLAPILKKIYLKDVSRNKGGSLLVVFKKTTI